MTQRSSKRRLCCDKEETVNHITYECSKFAQKGYKTIHDWVAKVIDWEMFKKLRFVHKSKRYMHNPESLLENETLKILCDFQIKTLS